MPAEHTRRSAGVPCVLPNTTKTTIMRPPLSSKWVADAILIACLLILTTRQRLSVENNTRVPSYGSQFLLYSAYLNNGCARVPNTLQRQAKSASQAVGLKHLLLLVLLAGDVEINPGPHPPNNIQTNSAPQTQQTQGQPVWPAPNAQFNVGEGFSAAGALELATPRSISLPQQPVGLGAYQTLPREPESQSCGYPATGTHPSSVQCLTTNAAAPSQGPAMPCRITWHQPLQPPPGFTTAVEMLSRRAVGAWRGGSVEQVAEHQHLQPRTGFMDGQWRLATTDDMETLSSRVGGASRAHAHQSILLHTSPETSPNGPAMPDRMNELQLLQTPPGFTAAELRLVATGDMETPSWRAVGAAVASPRLSLERAAKHQLLQPRTGFTDGQWRLATTNNTETLSSSTVGAPLAWHRGSAVETHTPWLTQQSQGQLTWHPRTPLQTSPNAQFNDGQEFSAAGALATPCPIPLPQQLVGLGAHPTLLREPGYQSWGSNGYPATDTRLAMASKRPHQPRETEGRKKRRQDGTDASAADSCLAMASRRPHQPGETEETKKRRQDEDEASAADQVREARIELINRIGDASLKAILDGLQKGRPAVITSRERNTVLQESRVIEDQVTCLVDMMLKKGERACEKFLSLLEENDPALWGDIFGAGTSTSAPPPASRYTASKIGKYKTSVQSSYENVKEYNSRPGEKQDLVLLSERYTELQMVECHRKPEEREEEIHSRGERLQQVLRSRSSGSYIITVEQLFRPDGRGRVPKAVILQGHPGYGKSFTSQKIMLDWASGTLFKDLFHLVFHLECKEINEISGECSLVDLLYSLNFTSDTEDVLRDPNITVLFLVDGFDELRFSLEGASSALPKDPFTKAPVQATLKALLRGHILPQCKLLVTTRSTATNTLSHLITDRCFQRFVDILGFTEEGVKGYFRSFFQNKHKADTLFEYVRTNETLYTSCFIPVICWVICSVFRAQELKGPHITLETNTSIYANFVSILLDHHSRSLNLPVPVLLSSLGRLAEKGMKDKCVLFTKKDVLSAVSDPESTVPHLTTGPFLCGFIRKEAVKMEEMFSFMHLSFQEFFTALHYTLDQEGEKRLASLLNSQEHWESHRRPVIQFLFGLANKEMQSLEYLQSTMCASSIRNYLKKWIMKKIQKLQSYDERFILSLSLFICLYELHEEEFVGKAMHDLGKLYFNTRLTRMDFWVLRYCLLCCPIETPIQKLVLIECGLTAEMLRMLQPALSRCQDLSLDLIDVHDDDDIWTFLSSLMKGHKLQKLSLNVKKDSLEDVAEFISSLAEKHILMRQRFELHLRFWRYREAYSGWFLLSTVHLPEACQSIEHLKTVGEADLSVHNWRTDQIHEDSLRGISYRLVIDLTLSAGNVNDAHDTRMGDDDEAGDSEMTGTSSETTEEDDDDPLQGLKNACSAFEGADSDDEDDPAEYDLEELFSSLLRVPGLKEVDINLDRSLNHSWKSDILSLVNNHPTLQRLRLEFTVIWHVLDTRGATIEIKRPDCTVIIKGFDPENTFIFRKNFFCVGSQP